MKNLGAGKIGSKILLLVFLLIIICLAIWWYWPDMVVNRAMKNLARVKTHHFNTVATITDAAATSELLGEPAQLQLKADGAYDMTEPRGKLAANVSITAQTDSLAMVIAGEIRFIDDHAYILITNTPSIFPIFAATKGRWIELPRGGEHLTEELSTSDELFTDISRSGWRTYNAQATPQAILKFLDGVTAVMGSELTDEQVSAYRDTIMTMDDISVGIGLFNWRSRIKYLNTVLALPDGNHTEVAVEFSERNKPVDIEPPPNFLTLDDLPSP